MHLFIEKSRARIKAEGAAPVTSRVAGLFEQFTLRGGQARFAGIDASGGQLPYAGADHVTVLALKQNEGVATGGVGDAKHDDRAGVTDDVAASAVIAFLDIVGEDGKNRSLINALAGEKFYFGHTIGHGCMIMVAANT